MDNVKCQDSPPLNICNEREIDALATTLNCLATDLYEAVAFVGDRACCIRTYIEKRVARGVQPRLLIKLREIPPVWEETSVDGVLEPSHGAISGADHASLSETT